MTAKDLDKELDLHWNAILALETRIDLLEAERVTRQAVDMPDSGTLALIAELKAWRTEQWEAMRAEGSKAPAYSVIPDKAINSIAVNLPRDRFELTLVHGIGPGKAEQYGADILAIVAKYVDASGTDTSGDQPW